MAVVTPLTEISAGRLLSTPGHAPAQHNKRISIREGRITAISDESTDQCPSSLVMPALANGHDHGRGLRRLAYGALDDALEVWLAASSGLHPPIDPYLVAVNAFARMVRSGVTATVHCHMPQRFDQLIEEAKAVCQAAQDIGIRIAFVVPMLDRNRLAYGEDEAVLALLKEEDRAHLRERWVGPLPSAADQVAMVDTIAAEVECAQVNVQFGPFGLEWASDELLGLVAETSAATGRRIHMHCQETRHQRAWVDHVYPDGFVHHLDRLGVLSPRLTLAHCVWLRREEWQLLAERGVTVATNASSNLRLGSGIAPIADMMADGVRVAFGVDALSLDDDDDALRELRLTYQLHSGNSFDAPDRQARFFHTAMTTAFEVIDGAEDQGALTPGAPADFIELDYDLLAEDVISDRTTEVDLILGRATRRHIRRVIAQGKELVQDGRILGVDEAMLSSELLAQARAGAPQGNAFIPALERYQAAARQFYNDGHYKR